MASKVVVIGSVNGSFRDLFTKLSKVQTKNNFSLAIITGDLFGPAASEDDISCLLQGSIPVPLPTYFTLGKHALPPAVIQRLESNEDLCPNLFYLGRKGTYKTTEGIRIIYLGGSFSQEAPHVTNAETKYLPTWVESDARSLHGANTADILLTSEWPLGIKTGSTVTVPEDVKAAEEQQAIADLTATLKPRYHLSTSENFFYEREPFFHLPTDGESLERPITRFISLASFNNPSKTKWLYAFTMDPKAPIPTTVPAGVSASPLVSSRKRSALPSQKASYSRYNNHDDNNDYRHSKRRRKGGPVNHGPEECYFCLSNPNIATHMICSIGEESYVTIAKGPLPLSSTYSSLGFPMHMLILPLAHTSNYHDITAPSSGSKTYNEMQLYRHAMYSMIHSLDTTSPSNEAPLGAICFEVSRKFVRHFVWQFLPFPSDKINRGLVEAAFKISAEKAELPPFAKFSSTDLVPIEKGDYFRFWTWTPPSSQNGNQPESEPTEAPTDAMKEAPSSKKDSIVENGQEKSFILTIPPETRFDINFGRRVVASLMQLDNRSHWKDCEQTLEEETEATEKFKKGFEAWDFTE
ncbi:hypothetical protein UCRPC4_g00708 [Phaeomoniella chlamydospora]|uniref:Uncharacterized protein n=1 Tax=Phaeomoniella chlamydospora TaxID=158046 RepID=A0A0G2GXS9_PHACM|nr:hypothetical protein UCRPC4_g00708 [Phaeomoniella chlamydospora]